MQPLVRTLARTRSLFLVPKDERPPKELEEELDRLESRYEIFKIQLFQEYRKYVAINSGAALLLAMILAALAFKADDPITQWTAVMMTALSILPAPITLGMLWRDASRQVKPMKEKADEMEKRALRASSSPRAT